MKFNFPATRFVDENSAQQQAHHVMSEAAEVQEELDREGGVDVERVDLEMMDLWHSAESYFRKRIKERGEDYVNGMRDRVIVKNDVRGYYP